MVIDELVIKLSMRAAEVNATLAHIGSQLKAMETSVSAFGRESTIAGLRLGAIGAIVAEPLRRMVVHFSEAGDAMAKMSIRTGVAVEDLGRLKFAAELSGSDIGTVSVALRGMSRVLNSAAGGSKGALKTLVALKVSLEELKGKGPEEKLGLLFTAIAKIEDPTKRTALAMQVFGRAGNAMMPFILEGAEGIKRLGDRAEFLGTVMSASTAKAAEELNDRFDELRLMTEALGNTIGKALAPMVQGLIAWTMSAIKVVQEWVKSHEGAVTVIAKVGMWLGILGSIFVIAGTAAGVLSSAIWILSKVLMVFRGILIVVNILMGIFDAEMLVIVAAVVALVSILAVLIVMIYILRNGVKKSWGEFQNLTLQFNGFIASIQDGVGVLGKFKDEILASNKVVDEHKSKMARLKKEYGSLSDDELAVLSSTIDEVEKSFKEFTATLYDQMNTIHLTEAQASLYKQQMKLLDLPVKEQAEFNDELDRFQAIVMEIGRQTVFKDLKKDITDMVDELKIAIATFGMSEDAVKQFKLQQRINNAAEPDRPELQRRLNELDPLIKQRAEQEAAKKKAEEVKASHDKAMQEGVSLHEKYRTAIEKFNDETRKIFDLWKQGAISAEDYTRAMRGANKELKDAQEKEVNKGFDHGQFQEVRTALVDVQTLSLGQKDPMLHKLAEQLVVQKETARTLKAIQREKGLR